MTDYRHLVVRREPPVCTITLDRPEVRNACDPVTHREIQSALTEFDRDPELRVAVLAGAGPSFCAGSDVRHTAGLDDAGLREYVRLDFETKNVVASVGKPVIAATHGHVVGGGLELALACDLRIAHRDTVFFFGELRLGTIPGAGGVQRLRDVVGLGVATDWVLSGRVVHADEALRRGLVNRVVDAADDSDLGAVGADDGGVANGVAGGAAGGVVGAALGWARELAAIDPVAITLAKAALRPSPALPGLVGTFHELASVACHNTGTFQASSADLRARRRPQSTEGE